MYFEFFKFILLKLIKNIWLKFSHKHIFEFFQIYSQIIKNYLEIFKI